MPRFYLDVLHEREVREDPEGQEFADLEAARAEAVASARYLVAHGILSNEDLSDRSFLIRAENEDVLLTVPFRDTLPGTLKGGALPRSHHSAQPHVPAPSPAAAACLAQQRAEQDFEWLLEEHGCRGRSKIRPPGRHRSRASNADPGMIRWAARLCLRGIFSSPVAQPTAAPVA